MIFTFLKYLQPTHYFTKKRKDGSYIFPIYQDLPSNIIEAIPVDLNYKSKIASEYDLVWKAINMGYISEGATYQNFTKLPIIDEYRFIRKNFNSFWVLYVMIIRTLSLNNPIMELKSWSRTQKVKREKYTKSLIKNDLIKKYKPLLIDKNPLISVIIPTLNRYEFLSDVLHDFENQTHKNFEIIIVDQSDNFKPEFYNQFKLKINVIQQKEKALWLARNTAIRCSNGEYIALSEDDVRIGPNWLIYHLKCLDYYNADISAGVFYPEGQSIPPERSFFKLASQFATGNALLKKTIFNEIGLFDRQFEKQRMGDGEFGFRSYFYNYKSISNPIASCVDVKASVGGLREMGSWDAYRPTKLFSPRPIPSVLYFYRKYFGNKRAVLDLLKSVPLSIIPYKFKRNKTMMIIGIIIAIILLPIILYQVIRSWYLSSKKLHKGALIETIN